MGFTNGEHARVEALEAQLVTTQEKLLFLEEHVARLRDALADKERALVAVERRVEIIEAALTKLAQRTVTKSGDEIANAEEDPVPSSG